MRKLIATFLLFASVAQLQAAGLDLANSAETATFQVLGNPYGLAQQTSEIAVGGLINEADDLLFFASVMARGPRQSEAAQYTLGAGMKIYAGSLDLVIDDKTESQSVGALAIGAKVSILVLPHKVNPIDFVLEGFFAPSITSAGDAEKLWEFGGRFQVEVVPSARGYLGYRLIKVDITDHGKVKVDDNIHVGLSIDF